MENNLKKKLLKDRKVVEEINRHLWIESEKAGHDIGFDNAAADWLERFSKAWLEYHMPKKSAATTTESSTKKDKSSSKTDHSKKS
ncbi:MAG: hypothetical protein H6755_01110 [Candidatus Omnitrophica bacterium]|nr:hypothetical protein [Candidatus Omnitrophota bacterium]MCB9746989.1 hypothetical protein [Candidatus Omnitrophota bacterium]